MKSSSHSVKHKSEISGWIFNSSLLVTICLFSPITDPFNSPKSWVLMICAAVLSGPILTRKITLHQSDKKLFAFLKIVLLLFLVSSLVSTLLSYDIQTSIFGENFRRNGFLTIISFLAIFYSSLKFVSSQDIGNLFRIVSITSLIVGGYAIIQITKNDFIIWSNPNAIITTLGNTNFSGSAMAILMILCFGQIFLASNTFYRKLFLVAVMIVLLIAIKATQARQAVIILIIGVTIILIFQIYIKNIRLGKLLLLLAVPIGVTSILGMLQIGPLQNLLYKGSLTIRGYYWRAGIEMFFDNPFFGVGIDSYGKFFKEFREVDYPLNYGFSITSTNAHNTIIQYFATGGFIVGFTYLIIQIFTLYISLKLIRQVQNDEKKVIITLIAAWIAFQAQSLISIENVGISVWGWLLGGCLNGLYFSNKLDSKLRPIRNKKSIQINWKSGIVSGISTLIVLFIVAQLYSGERNTYLSRYYAAPQSTDPKVKDLFNVYALRALNSRFINNDYRNIVLSGKFEMGYTKESLNELETILKSDPRNLDTLILLALGNEQLRNFEVGIKYRKEIAKYDPWNAQNYLALGVVYKEIQDYDSMQAMLDKIMSFAANDPTAVTAKNELVKPTK